MDKLLINCSFIHYPKPRQIEEIKPNFVLIVTMPESQYDFTSKDLEREVLMELKNLNFDVKSDTLTYTAQKL